MLEGRDSNSHFVQHFRPRQELHVTNYFRRCSFDGGNQSSICVLSILLPRMIMTVAGPSHFSGSTTTGLLHFECSLRILWDAL